MKSWRFLFNKIFFCGGVFLLVGLFLSFFSQRKEIEKKINEGHQLKSQKDVKQLIKAIGKYEEALVLAIEAIEGKFEAQKLLGIQLAFKKYHQGCVENLEKAKEIKSQDAILHYYLGLCHTHLAQNTSKKIEKNMHIAKAKNTFAAGLKIDEKEYLLHYGMGVLLGFVIKKKSKAIEYLENAYQLNNNDSNVLFALANLYYQNGHKSKAAATYRKILSLFPKNSKQYKQAKENIISMGQQP